MSEARAAGSAAPTRASTNSSRARCGPGARPVDPDPTALVSPGRRHRQPDRARSTARDRCRPRVTHYTLEALLGRRGAAGRHAFARRCIRDACTSRPTTITASTCRCAGTLRAAWYVPGQLFSVNAVTAAQRARTVRAQRARGLRVRGRTRVPFAMVLVGALFVGSMATVWHGDVTPREPRRARGSCRSIDGAAPAALREGR